MTLVNANALPRVDSRYSGSWFSNQLSTSLQPTERPMRLTVSCSDVESSFNGEIGAVLGTKFFGQIMNQNFWTVNRGVLGTLEISNGHAGRFFRARVLRSDQKRRRNVVRSLRYERDERSLARNINRTIDGAVDPDDPLFSRVAVASNTGLFARGDRFISIHAKHKIEVVKIRTVHLFTRRALAEVNDYLCGRFATALAGEGAGRLRKLKLSDLPPEIDVVYSIARDYMFAGTSLKRGLADRILGLHERTVGMIESVLQAASGSSERFCEQLASYKRRSEAYRYLRARLRALVTSVRTHATKVITESRPSSARETLAKLGREGARAALLNYLAHSDADALIPMYIGDAHKEIRNLLELASGDESLPDFARFQSDLQQDLYELVEELLNEEACS